MSAPAIDPFRVLVIEDDPNLRQVITALLADEGYGVASAESGEEAIEISRTQPFDLIVADIRMPGIDGLDTLEHLRAEDPTLHSLVMTGYASEEDPIRALHIGVQAYLRKPFSLDDFLSRVRDLAGRCRAVRQQKNALENVGQSLNWALKRNLADSVPTGPRTFVELLQLVRALAVGLGVESQGQETPWLDCAAMVACLRRYALQGQYHEPPWPAPVELILHSLEERWDGQGVPDGLVADDIPVGSRLVSLALAAWLLGYRLGEGQADRLQSLEQGRYDPQMIRLLSHVEAGIPVSPERSAQRLLPIATILLENGAYRQVRELYSEVLSHSPLARDRMEALLGLTQVALQQNDVDEALRHARHFIERSESVGPLSRGEAYLRLGVALCGKGLSTGLECFKRALSLFGATRYRQGHTEASLALAHFGNRVLELTSEELHEFIRPEHLPRWIRSASWLVPCLLDRCDDEDVVRRVVRTVHREYPSLLKKLQGGNSLSAVALHRLTAILDLVSREVRQEVVAPGPPPLQIYSLGNFELFCQGNRLDERVWPTQKVKFLLARLLLDVGRPVSEDSLIDDFWGGELEKGRRNLSWALTQLRKVLREQTGEGSAITRQESSVVLHFKELPWHDLSELEKAFSQTESEPALLAQLCSPILALYRAPYLPDCYMDWAVRARDRLERKISTFLSQILQGLGVSDALRAEVAHRLLESDPCHQPAYLELMAQALQSGRPEEALRLFKKASGWLKRDLGIEPDIKLIELSFRAEIGLSSAGAR